MIPKKTIKQHQHNKQEETSLINLASYCKLAMHICHIAEINTITGEEWNTCIFFLTLSLPIWILRKFETPLPLFVLFKGFLFGTVTMACKTIKRSYMNINMPCKIIRQLVSRDLCNQCLCHEKACHYVNI